MDNNIACWRQATDEQHVVFEVASIFIAQHIRRRLLPTSFWQESRIPRTPGVAAGAADTVYYNIREHKFVSRMTVVDAKIAPS